MQIGNVTKAATFKTSLHQSYKSAQLLLLWQSFLVIFTRRFFGATQKLELHFSFKPTTLLKLYSKMVIFWENFEIFEKLLLDIFFHYRGVFKTLSKIYDRLFGENSQAKDSILDIWLKGGLFLLPLRWPQESILRLNLSSAFLHSLLLQMLSTLT